MAIAGVETNEPMGQPTPGLDADALAILEFERSAPRGGGPKARAIRERFGCSPVRYRYRLHRVVASPEALLHDPVLVGRLRRHMENRRYPGFGATPHLAPR